MKHLRITSAAVLVAGILALITACNMESPHEHTFSDDWNVDETHHWHVATCEHKDQVKDKAEHKFGEWTVTTAATEESEGSKERICSVCGYIVTEEITKLNHVHAKGTHHDAVGGTCVKKGTVEYYDCEKTTCEVKLDKEGKPLATIEDELNPSNHTGTATTWTKTATKHKETYDCCKAVKTAEAEHSFGEWTVKTPATCTTDGSKERLCKVCSYTETAVIEKTGHSYATEWTIDKTSHWHVSTCEHTAEISDKAAHTFGDWIVKTPVSCTTDGSKERLCTACSYTETAVIEKTGHSYATTWTTATTHHWHAATCGHTAEISDKAEHTFNGTVCTVCNCEKPVAQTITVTKGDNTYEDPQNN